MDTPRVSVCLPVSSPDPVFLREALESVFAQTYTSWELLIHDDCSPVDPRPLVERLTTDPRVRYARAERKLGIGGNWNATAAMGTAPLVAYLFQDDRWHPRYLARAVEALERHPSADLVALHHRYDIRTEHDAATYRALETLRAAAFAQPFAGGAAFLRAWLRRGLHPNVVGEPDFIVVKRDALERAGWWDERMRQCLDIEGVVRILRRGDIAFVAEESGTFRVHDASTTSQNRREHRGLFDRITILARSLLRGPLSVRCAALFGLVAALPGMAGKMLRRFTRMPSSGPQRP